MTRAVGSSSKSPFDCPYVPLFMGNSKSTLFMGNYKPTIHLCSLRHCDMHSGRLMLSRREDQVFFSQLLFHMCNYSYFLE